jgi:GTP-binding protein
MESLRNIAIIAHVDHGKTTLVDSMFKQSGTYKAHQEIQERAMDSNDIEKERGITILAKCTSIKWNDLRINIVDTPGHADFGGEVERVLSMIDGVLLLVDAAEGPMPQTKFVLSKALDLNLHPIVVINKADKSDARPEAVVDEILDLFISLGASESQLNFPVIYASAKQGWAINNLNDQKQTLEPLFEAILNHIPSPSVDYNAPFSMLATILDVEPYLGRILTGRIQTGSAKINAPIKTLDLEGNIVETGRLTKILAYRGLKRIPVDEAWAGDIIAIAGLKESTVTNTIAAPEITEPIKAQPIDPPTLSMTFSVNTSPLSGREGTKVTNSMIFDRLIKEAEHNISILIKPTDDSDSMEVQGRGELQLGILIENMRREGFELSVSRPQVVYKKDEKGNTLEPIEEVIIDVDEEYSGIIMEGMGLRRGEMIDMSTIAGNKTRLKFLVPSRSLIGYQNQFMTMTRGTGTMTRLFNKYAPFKGHIEKQRNGVLVSGNNGKVSAYALIGLEDRGTFLVTPGQEVYEGMIIGIHNRANDLIVNPIKAKQLSNMRSATKDETVKIPAGKQLTLEQAVTFIEEDELVEATPSSIRIRKKKFKK